MVPANYKNYQWGVFYKGAPHTETKLTPDECKLLMSELKAFYVRNVYDWDCAEQTSFWFIIQDKPIRMEDLHSKCRNQVRRAYKTLVFKRQTHVSDIDELYDVYFSSFSRYKIKTSSPLSRAQFQQYIKNAPDNMEWWGAYDNETGKMIAYAEVIIQSNSVKYTALKAIPEHMNRTYPFYGLLFEMNKFYLEEQKMLYVTDGARSITEHSNIQSFLDKFNFRRAYCHLKVTYIWWLRIIISILYPVRRILWNSKIGYLLRFEAINRNEY